MAWSSHEWVPEQPADRVKGKLVFPERCRVCGRLRDATTEKKPCMRGVKFSQHRETRDGAK